MRTNRVILFLLTLALVAVAAPAFAQIDPYNVSWAALNPGNDWAAQVIRSIFPIPGGTPGTSTGNEAAVIQQMVGQFTGFVAAIACAFVVYTVIINIHRAAETSQILGNNQSWMFVVRVGFAGIMMFPLGGGFSAGQALVMQGAMLGVGMAKALYTNAINAIGPDAIVIAQPMVPGTEQIVAGLIDNELCMDLINLASNTVNGPNGPLVPIPQPVPVNNNYNGGGTTFRYNLSTGNGWGNPACGTVTILQPQQNPTTVAGITVDMAAVQNAVLTNVLTGSIRNQVATIAQNLWQQKTAASLTPLQDVFTGAVNSYTQGLTIAATSTQSQINAALKANAQQARNGNLDLLQNQLPQSTLGWTAAGAYYLEIARLNAATLSLLNARPVTTSPTYDGIGPALSYDLAPLVAAHKDFMTTMKTIVKTTDGTTTPSGLPNTLASAKEDTTDAGVLDRVLKSMNTDTLLHTITDYLLPTTEVWADPFGGLMKLGQSLMNWSLAALGAATLLASAVTSTGAALFEVLTFQWGAAAATVAGHAIMNFLGVPLFTGLLAILVPGITIAYVLPMIPWVIWMAGVAGWIILVCEAMIAVPLWMLAHMTVGGDGLHGRATEGWSLLFNVVFRPTLMVIGLFLGYFVFDCMSWLIRSSFGIAAGFVLLNGWLVTNLIGIAVLLTIFVMTHVIAAMMSFRMVALLPHHLPRLIGFTSANRVDMDAFQEAAAWVPSAMVARNTSGAITQGARKFGAGMKQLPRGPAGYISGPQGASGEEGGGAREMDTTLRASTDSSPRQEG
jgi:conjugal transfer/type IV secretion protein DotA/TraY